MQRKVDLPLTKGQQKLVSDSHKLIYSYARSMNLDLDEYYGVLAIGLCKAAAIFDPDLGYTFSTLAYVAMKNECATYYNSLYRQKRYAPSESTISLDAMVFDDPYSKEYYDKIDGDINETYASEIVKIELKEFIQTLRKTDRIILSAKLHGYSQTEIAKNLGMTGQNVSDRLHVLKRRWDDNRYRLK